MSRRSRRPGGRRRGSVAPEPSAAISSPIAVGHRGERDVLVVARLGLGGGVKIGSIRSLSTRPGGQRLAADRARRPVFLPAAAREVAADDALERDDLGLADEHRPARRAPRGRRPGGRGPASSMSVEIRWLRDVRAGRTRRRSGRSGRAPCRGCRWAGPSRRR